MRHEIFTTILHKKPHEEVRHCFWVLLARHHENPYSNTFHRNSFLPSGSRMQLASRLVALPCQSGPHVRKLWHWLYRQVTAITLPLTMPPSTSLLTPSTWCAFPQAVVAGLRTPCHVPCALWSRRSGGCSLEPRAWCWPGSAGWAKLHGSYFGGLSSTAQYKKHGIK